MIKAVSLDKEKWKWINGYKDLYMISNRGRVYSEYSGMILTPFVKGRDKNYHAVSLRKNNKQSNVAVHRIVAIHFLSNPLNASMVNHLDGNGKNNNVGNLEWCNHSQNQLHAYVNGLRRKPSGEINPNAKLTQREVDFLRWLKVHYPAISGKKIAEFYKISGTNINDIFTMTKWIPKT